MNNSLNRVYYLSTDNILYYANLDNLITTKTVCNSCDIYIDQLCYNFIQKMNNKYNYKYLCIDCFNIRKQRQEYFINYKK